MYLLFEILNFDISNIIFMIFLMLYIVLAISINSCFSSPSS